MSLPEDLDTVCSSFDMEKVVDAVVNSYMQMVNMAQQNHQQNGDKNGGDSISSKWMKAKKAKLKCYKHTCSRSNSEIITSSKEVVAVSVASKSTQTDIIEAFQSQNKLMTDIINIMGSNFRGTIKQINEVSVKVEQLLKMVHQMKLAYGYCGMPFEATVNPNSAEQALPIAPNLTADDGSRSLSRESTKYLDESNQNGNSISENEDFNRSDDNVLVTNKYETVSGKTMQENEAVEQEWVPIGDGRTKIHKDKYKKINWKSYTTATRTLLRELFPRKVLATHSLTGKPSPAFRNKPAKMCLDHNKISAVIMEVGNRFQVRENLIRSIITTKCADEAKMWKTSCKKKLSANKENTEN